MSCAAATAIFGFVPQSANALVTIVAIIGGYIFVTEIAKAWFFGHEDAQGDVAADRTGARDEVPHRSLGPRLSGRFRNRATSMAPGFGANGRSGDRPWLG